MDHFYEAQPTLVSEASNALERTLRHVERVKASKYLRVVTAHGVGIEAEE